MDFMPRVSRWDSLPSYIPGKPLEEVQREKGLSRVAKLASNENPLGASPLAQEAIQKALRNLHRYPDASSADLKRALAHRLGLSEENICVGSGSDEIIQYLGITLLQPGDETLAGTPGFLRYTVSTLLGGGVVKEIPLKEDGTHDLERMREAITERTRIIWIANPHNPTGSVIFSRELENFLKALPEGVTVVLDEAYCEFARFHPEYSDSLRFIQEGMRVIALRSLSKSHGLAGVRIGFALGPREWVSLYDRVRPPFNVSSLAQAAAIAALNDDTFLKTSIEHARQALERLTRILTQAGARTFPSFANFLWADFGWDTRPLYERLLDEGVIIRTGHLFGKPTCVRVSVGTWEELDLLEDALPRVLRSLGSGSGGRI